jgi:hypothetical protein
MENNKKIFIEEGFFPSQLLWIVIIFLEYCKKKKIKEILFEKKYDLIFKNKIIKKELEGFKVIFLDDELPFYLKNKFSLYFLLLPKSFFLSLFFKKDGIAKKKWHDYQLYHSILDTALSLSKDGVTTPKYWIILKSIYLNLKKIEIANFLLKKNISTVVSSHNVYFVKSFNSIFRKKNIPIYCQAVSNIYKQPKNKDENWNILHNKNLRKKILNKIKRFFG